MISSLEIGEQVILRFCNGTVMHTTKSRDKKLIRCITVYYNTPLYRVLLKVGWLC